MSWLTAIIIVLIILILCIYVVGYLHDNGTIPSDPFQETISHMKRSFNKTYDNYVTKPEDLYTATIGHLRDEIVDTAIEKTSKKETMYTRNENDGTLSDDNLLDATNNAFILAELTRFNVIPNDTNGRPGTPDIWVGGFTEKAADYYRRAINRIQKNPNAVIEGGNQNTPAIETIILRAEDFYEDAIARDMLNVQNIQNIPNFNQVRDGVREARVNAARLGPTINTQRNFNKVKIKKDKVTKREAQDNYFEAREIRNDPQNVHDTQATRDMINKYNRLVEKNSGDIRDGAVKKGIQNIKKYLNKYKFSDKSKKNRALKAFEKISEGNFVTSLNASDSDVLINVWNRAYSPENVGRKDEILPVIIDSMVECVEPSGYGGDYVICAHGRAQHLIDSLTLMDNDETLNKSARTAETLRNEIFSKAHLIIQEELKNTDTMIARAYNGVLDEPRPGIENDVEMLEQKMRDKIEETLKNEFKDVESKVLNELIKDAQAGV